jgi:hypothetical protein
VHGWERETRNGRRTAPPKPIALLIGLALKYSQIRLDLFGDAAKPRKAKAARE